MKIGILTDMEGLAGVEGWAHCRPSADDGGRRYREGLGHLAGDTNAAVAGACDAGAESVAVWDGHGANGQAAFTRVRLDPRAVARPFRAGPPIDFEGLDGSLAGVAVVGQHAMAGTLHGFLDHTQRSKELCRYSINGEEHGELSQFALYAGAFGVPLRYVSGDEALCAEARRLFPWVVATPTKRGVAWEECELYPPEHVRENIRRDCARAFARPAPDVRPWRLPMPVEVTLECAWSGLADQFAVVPGVRRLHARIVSWKVHDPRYIYTWPSAAWHPPL